jgi:5'-nucleotidase
MPLLAAAIAVGVVLAAPLASPNPAGAKVVISGASSLTDKVSVRFADKPAKPPKPDKPAKPDKMTDIHILAFNDLHGTLQAGGNNIYGRFAGGAAYLAKAVKDRQAMYGDQQATVLAGDNIGATPLENGLFFEEPITIISNLMHVDFGSVGNHEFDKGSAELQRIQNGGCRPVEGCTAAPYALANGGSTNVYPGADFQYLSANVTVNATGETLFPAYVTKRFKAAVGNVEVGFIGEVLETTPTIVTPTGVAGLTFEDEAEAANRVLEGKNARNVDTWVLVIHEGGNQSGAPALNGCAGALSGSPILDIASRLDPAIKVIVSAHTHNEYRCTITTNGVTRLITSASSFGRILTDITLTFDKTSDLVEVSATNSIVENALNPRESAATIRQPDPSKEDPQVQAVVNQYVVASAPLANQVIGSIQADLTRTGTPFGESALGDVIADAQLVATQPVALGDADIALMNPGGIRADLIRTVISGGEAIGQVTYGEAFTVQPFGNSLVTKTMTGDMLRRLLQQQFALQVNPLPAPATPCLGGTVTSATSPRVLQVSSTFKYESAPSAPTCEGKIGRMWVKGVEVQPTDTFRVTMNNFLAAGGDGFTVFNEGTNALGGAQDIDAFVAYFALSGAAGIPLPTLNRIVAKP